MFCGSRKGACESACSRRQEPVVGDDLRPLRREVEVEALLGRPSLAQIDHLRDGLAQRVLSGHIGVAAPGRPGPKPRSRPRVPGARTETKFVSSFCILAELKRDVRRRCRTVHRVRALVPRRRIRVGDPIHPHGPGLDTCGDSFASENGRPSGNQGSDLNRRPRGQTP